MQTLSIIYLFTHAVTLEGIDIVSTQQGLINASDPFQEPRIVSIHHDGIEVVRVEDGMSVELDHQVDISAAEPQKLEIFWDGVLVYCIDKGQVTVNDMRDLLQKRLPLPLSA